MALHPQSLQRLPKKNIEEARSILDNVKKYLKDCVREALAVSKDRPIIRKERI